MLAALALALLAGFAAPANGAAPVEVTPHQEETVAPYVARVYFDAKAKDGSDSYFEILKDGKPVYVQKARRKGEKFFIGTMYKDDPDAAMRGYQLLTNAEIFRGRYLNSFSKPEAIRAGTVREYKYSLHDVDHVFKAGHTILVEMQSTWFPLYDRNPQSFVPNIMKASPGDYKAATITIYAGPGHESELLVPVVGN